MTSPFDTLRLVSFLITGLIITRLVINVRAGTGSSRLQQELLQQLYDLAQHLLARNRIQRRESIPEAILWRFRYQGGLSI